MRKLALFVVALAVAGRALQAAPVLTEVITTPYPLGWVKLENGQWVPPPPSTPSSPQNVCPLTFAFTSRWAITADSGYVYVALDTLAWRSNTTPWLTVPDTYYRPQCGSFSTTFAGFSRMYGGYTFGYYFPFATFAVYVPTDSVQPTFEWAEGWGWSALTYRFPSAHVPGYDYVIYQSNMDLFTKIVPENYSLPQALTCYGRYGGERPYFYLGKLTGAWSVSQDQGGAPNPNLELGGGYTFIANVLLYWNFRVGYPEYGFLIENGTTAFYKHNAWLILNTPPPGCAPRCGGGKEQVDM